MNYSIRIILVPCITGSSQINPDNPMLHISVSKEFYGLTSIIYINLIKRISNNCCFEIVRRSVSPVRPLK